MCGTYSQTPTKDDSSTTTDSEEKNSDSVKDHQATINCQDEENGLCYIESMMIQWKQFSV